MGDNEQQPPKKKPRISSGEEEDLFLRALEICYENRLPQDLDLVEVAMLRLTSKGCGKIAARMAKNRMRNLRLEYRTVYLNSMAALRPHGGEDQLEKHRVFANDDGAGVHEWDWKTLPQEEKQARMEAGTSGYVFTDSVCLSVEVTVVVDSLGEQTADEKWMTDARKQTVSQNSYVPKLVFPLGDPMQLEVGTSLFITGHAGEEDPMEALKLEWEILTSTVQTIHAAPNPEAETIHHRGSFRIKSVTWDFLTLLIFVLYHKENALNYIKEDKEDAKEPLTKEEEQLQRVLDLAETIFPPYFRIYDGF